MFVGLLPPIFMSAVSHAVGRNPFKTEKSQI